MTAERARILIVDDEPSNITVIASLLKADYGLMVARSGEQALKSARALPPPDLVLLDIIMPGMDGYEVCRQLKADPATRDIPVMFISAMSETADETRGLDLGAVDYITKPISAPILQARVRTHLALRHNQEKLQEAYAIIKLQKDRMQEELNVGREIQMGMMPLDFPGPPSHPELALYASLQAAREVGGDFYDFGFVDDDHLYLCVGDVSGKGVPAALLMAVTKTLIKAGVKAAAAQGEGAAAAMTRVNDAISADNDRAMFVTVFLAICDIRSGEMVYCNAGHNPPYIQRADGSLERLTARHGMVVGGLEGLNYRESRTVLAPGEGLLLFTDGVTEAANAAQELFDEHRLVALLQQHHDSAPQPLVEALVDGVHAYENGAEQADDITVLAFRFVGAAGPVEQHSHHWRGLASSAEVQRWFEPLVADWGVPDAQRRKLNMALDDLLQNLISHAYADEVVGDIGLSVARYGDHLLLELSDDGSAFDPTQCPPPDLDLDVDERPIGGLGLHLVKQLMDEVSYRREDGWNRLSLKLLLGEDQDL